jgi:hypothetical protein
VADDVTPGELGHRIRDLGTALDQRLREHEARTDRIHAEQDNRITQMAAKSVQTDVYQSDQRAVAELARRLERDRVEDVRRLREDVINPALVRIAALELVNANRPTMSFTRWVGVLGVVVGFLAVVVTVWATSRGAK